MLMFHIVDDESMMCSLIETVIKSAGYDAMFFYSAAAYLKHMQSHLYIAPVALLTDYMMPKMDGCQLATEVHKQLPQQPIILISGHDGLGVNAQASMHFYDHLAKPFHAKALIALLNTLLLNDLYPSPTLREVVLSRKR